jgi:hypothetical protein
MVFTNRFWSGMMVLLCTLLLQNCQSALRATEEEELAAGLSSASSMRQSTSSGPLAMQSLISPSASLAAHVASSRFSTTLANEEVLSTALSSCLLITSAPATLATVGNSPTVLYDFSAAAIPRSSYAAPLSNKLSTPSPDSPRVCVGRVEGVLREMPSDAEESSKNLAPQDKRTNKKWRAREEVEPDNSERVAKDVCLRSLKTLEEAEEQDCAEQERRSGDPLTILLDVASSKPAKVIQFLDFLFVAAQDKHCRQRALEALGKVVQASPDMLSECLPSLRTAAKTGDKDVRLLALKTLGEVEWKHYFGEVEPAPDLPSNMTAILDSACPFWPEKKVGDTHLLVLIPAKVNGQRFSLNLLHDLIQHPSNGGHKTQYSYYASEVEEQLGEASPAASYWLLMSRDVLPGSRRKTYAAQQKLVADHARATRLPYELPKVLEAATAILTNHVRNGERLYGDSPWTFTRCQEWVLYKFNEYPAFVGGFESSGLDVDYFGHCDYDDCGVGGCIKLNRCVRRDVLNVVLTMAGSEPAKAIRFLDALLVAAQDSDFRQQALEALGKVAQASPDMFSECLPSLRTAAKTGHKDVRLLALKTLGEVEWKHYFGEVEPAPDLPKDIATILESTCPFWPDKKVKDTHLLVLIPATVDGAPFTLNLLKELIQCPKNGEHKTEYHYYGSDVQVQIGAASPAASYWLLMTRDVLPGSRDKTYADQERLIADHASRTSLPYEMPKALEAATAILTHYVRDGERLYQDSPWTFTRCQEWISYRPCECPAVVGGFGSSGLGVCGDSYHYGNRFCGVAGCRKF